MPVPQDTVRVCVNHGPNNSGTFRTDEPTFSSVFHNWTKGKIFFFPGVGGLELAVPLSFRSVTEVTQGARSQRRCLGSSRQGKCHSRRTDSTAGRNGRVEKRKRAPASEPHN